METIVPHFQVFKYCNLSLIRFRNWKVVCLLELLLFIVHILVGKANGHAVSPEEPETAAEKPSVIARIVKAFSLYQTLPRLFDTTPKPNQLQGLDGIRFLSMSWVILGHVWSMAARFGSPSEWLIVKQPLS